MESGHWRSDPFSSYRELIVESRTGSLDVQPRPVCTACLVCYIMQIHSPKHTKDSDNCKKPHTHTHTLCMCVYLCISVYMCIHIYIHVSLSIVSHATQLYLSPSHSHTQKCTLSVFSRLSQFLDLCPMLRLLLCLFYFEFPRVLVSKGIGATGDATGSFFFT